MGRTRRIITGVVIAVALVLAAAGLFTGDDEIDRAAMLLSAAVALLAGTLIYIIATDDFQVRRQLFGPEADRRGRERSAD